MSVENFRTFVIHSRNQVRGGFDVDRLCPFLLSSIYKNFLFIRQTQPFLKRFCKRNFFECFRENRLRKSLAPEAEVRKDGSANNDANETPRLPISAGRASWVLEILPKFTLHTSKSPSRRVFSNFSCTGSQEVEQFGLTEAIFQYKCSCNFRVVTHIIEVGQSWGCSNRRPVSYYNLALVFNLKMVSF